MLDKVLKVINHLDEAADSIAEASNTIASHAVKILVATGVASAIGVTAVGFSLLIQGREHVGKAVLELILPKDSEVSLSTPWDLINKRSHPEFYREKNTGKTCGVDSVCEAHEERKKKIDKVLEDILAASSADRAIYSLYGIGYRQVVAQKTTKQSKPLDPNLWIVSTTILPYRESLEIHEQDLCNYVLIQELPDENLVKLVAPVYEVASLYSCPVNYYDIAHQVRGYITLDFSVNLVEKDKERVEILLRQAADKIEVILGYKLDDS